MKRLESEIGGKSLTETNHSEECTCNTCLAIDTGVMLEILYLQGKDQIGLTDSFRTKTFQKVKHVIEISKNLDGSITDPDDEILGRAVVSVLSEDYGISNIKELYNMTDMVIRILTIKK